MFNHVKAGDNIEISPGIISWSLPNNSTMNRPLPLSIASQLQIWFNSGYFKMPSRHTQKVPTAATNFQEPTSWPDLTYKF